jgi:putative transposase
VPVGVVIAGANVNDHLLMGETLDALPVTRPKPTKRSPQHLCLDKGYDYAAPRTLAKERGFILHLRRRGEEIQAKRHRGARARRWVVERAHAWLNRFRGILIRWPKKPQNYRALIHFACGIIAAQQALPG